MSFILFINSSKLVSFLIDKKIGLNFGTAFNAKAGNYSICWSEKNQNHRFWLGDLVLSGPEPQNKICTLGGNCTFDLSWYYGPGGMREQDDNVLINRDSLTNDELASEIKLSWVIAFGMSLGATGRRPRPAPLPAPAAVRAPRMRRVAGLPPLDRPGRRRTVESAAGGHAERGA